MADPENPLVRDLDAGVFREGLEPMEAVRYIRMVMEAYTNLFIQPYGRDVERLVEDLDLIVEKLRGISDIIKFGVYDRKGGERQ